MIWIWLCIRLRRYNAVTFVPRFLFEQFSQIAYFYFLVQVRLVQLFWYRALLIMPACRR